MSLVSLLDAQTPPPLPGPASPTNLRDSLMPDIPIRETFVITEANQYADVAAVNAYRSAMTGPKRDRLIEVIVEPGLYTAEIVSADLQITRGATGDPADVIFAPTGLRGGVVHSYGGMFWMRAITLRQTTQVGIPDGSKYPLHVSGPGTLGCIDVAFEAYGENNDGGGACIGLDGFDGLNWYMVGCTFDNILNTGITNIHGGNVGRHGQDIAFYDCTSLTEAPQDVGYAGVAPERCDIYVIGGNIVPGPMSGGAVAHTDNWPAPVGGFANYERIQLGI